MARAGGLTLDPAIASRLGLGELDLVELSTPTSGAALRAWTRIGEDGAVLQLGPDGLAALGAQPGDTVEIRAVPSSPS